MKYCYLLLVWFWYESVLGATPAPSQVMSTTCPSRAGYISQSYTPRLSYNWAEVLFAGCLNMPSVARYRTVNSNWKQSTKIVASGAVYATFDKLEPATVYEWQVACVCAPGDTSAYTTPISFTTLPCPAGGSYSLPTVITPTSVTLGGLSNPERYVFQWREENEPGWNTLNSLPVGPISLTGLTDRTSYEWRVGEVCSATAIGYSKITSFTTGCVAPTEPVTSDIGYTSARLNWQNQPGAVTEIQLQPQGATSWSALATNFTGNSYELAISKGHYNWRVRTVCGLNRHSGFTEPQSFTTGPCPNIDLWLSDLGSVSGYSAIIQVYGAVQDQYSIRWREQGNSEWHFVDDNSGGIFRLTGLRNKVRYELQGQRQCSATDRSAFSEPIVFTATCLTPFLTELDSYGLLSIRGLFEASGLVEWREKGTGLWHQSPLLNELNGFANTVWYQFGGKPQTAYEIRSKAVCADGSSSDYSPVRSYTLGSKISSGFEPLAHSLRVMCIGWRSAQVSWLSNTVYYGNVTVQWRQKNTDCWNTQIVTDSIQSPHYGTFTVPNGKCILNGLQPKTEYEFRIGKLLSESSEPVFTQPETFTTTDGAVVMYRNINCPVIGPDRVQIYFGTSVCNSELDQYECRYRPVGSDIWQSVRFITGQERLLTNLRPNTTYEYQVRLSVPNGYTGPFSNTETVTTAYADVGALVKIRVNGDNCRDLTVGWNYCFTQGATYQISYRRLDDSDDRTVEATTSVHYYTLKNLPSNTPYLVQVRAVYADGTLAPFVSGTFTSGCSSIPYIQPRNLCQYNLTETTAQLQWSSYGGISDFELQWRKGYTTSWNSLTVTGNANDFYPLKYKLTGLQPETVYEWKVRDLRGEPSYFTPVQFFRTVCNAPVYARMMTTGTTSASLNWTMNDENQFVTLHWRIKGDSAWQQMQNIGRSGYQLTSLKRNTVYEWRVATQCAAPSTLAHGPIQTFKTLLYNQLIYTVQAGNWTDPSVWFCNRLPTDEDGVLILHRVNIPHYQTGKAVLIRYGSGGTLSFEEKARLQLSF
ncbi:hypothetical protein F5984_09195 [Rudanella paleaurantiibacter]|uniref:Fibronectin type-III domain-containing protein n=1 Tax=Rudanella paleaurantiibacter TaxID=2614655 RepID=A0A7J5U021_9BACT|nr:fibronectin type III domain-containing protein [Rudanella paleaurantiibacter]KAB7730995.1 hypothetical protein F5984_09195 [Rudanella paleaurantiibacter]